MWNIRVTDGNERIYRLSVCPLDSRQLAYSRVSRIVQGFMVGQVAGMFNHTRPVLAEAKAQKSGLGVA